MMKKINIIQIFFLLSLIITICLINTTYAKYTENINPNLHVTLNQWLIKVNEQDIMGEESFENILAMQLNNDNDNINENVDLVICSKNLISTSFNRLYGIYYKL